MRVPSVIEPTMLWEVYSDVGSEVAGDNVTTNLSFTDHIYHEIPETRDSSTHTGDITIELHVLDNKTEEFSDDSSSQFGDVTISIPVSARNNVVSEELDKNIDSGALPRLCTRQTDTCESPGNEYHDSSSDVTMSDPDDVIISDVSDITLLDDVHVTIHDRSDVTLPGLSDVTIPDIYLHQVADVYIHPPIYKNQPPTPYGE